MTSFQSMGLPEALCHKLQSLQFETPTPIQAEAIPMALSGQDILGSAQTGTGKTAAFGLPLLSYLMENPTAKAVVLTPTRELAAQVYKSLMAFLAKKPKIYAALLIGGDPIMKQIKQLRQNPRLIVGTPGRMNDHLKQETLCLKDASFLVLDETDRMLDMGFTPQIESLIKVMPAKRQTLLFSATLSKKIEGIANRYLNNPKRIAVSSSTEPAKNIDQQIITLKESEKYPTLCDEIENREGSIIVFVKTKFNADRMALKLTKAGIQADAIHGDLRQNKRERVLENFRKKKYRVLIATDVAARGLDVPHIEHVINYDLPQSPEDYIHRIGRTARAGATGAALNLISPEDAFKWRAIEHFINPEKHADPGKPFKNSHKKRDRNRKYSDRSNSRPSGGKRPFTKSKTPGRGAPRKRSA